MEGNLTKGPILKTLTKLAIPIMASSFLGTLYNITDMAWIGLLGAKRLPEQALEYVYMALAGACFDGKNGRPGTDCTVHRTRREGKGTWICTDSDAVGIIDGTRIWDHCSTILQIELVGFSSWMMRKH